MELAVREERTATAPTEIEKIFEEHHGLIFRTAYRVTGNAADAEDVLQAVFLRLIRRDRPAEPLGNIESYLRRAAINVSLDIVRARQHVSGQESLLPDPAAVNHGELRDALRRALAALNPRSAEIFALRYFEGHTNPEIARALGMSQVHVAVLLHRTRKQLQKEMRPYLGARS